MMTEKELNNLYYIQTEIESLTELLDELPEDAGLGSVILDGMPRGTDIGDKTAGIAVKRAMLQERLKTTRERRIQESAKIYGYIEAVQDPEVRSIMVMRFIELKNWEEIGDKLYMYRKTAARKMRKYLSKH